MSAHFPQSTQFMLSCFKVPLFSTIFLISLLFNSFSFIKMISSLKVNLLEFNGIIFGFLRNKGEYSQFTEKGFHFWILYSCYSLLYGLAQQPVLLYIQAAPSHEKMSKFFPVQ